MRVYQQVLGAFLFVFLMVESIGLAQPQGGAATVYVRKNASTPAAKADLVALQTAIAKMKTLDCSDPRSWYYQGAIHWVPNDSQDGSNLKAGNPFCATYDGTDATLKEAWNNCTHSTRPEQHFLIWHRLYIFYLEEIVRDLSGKADFALPYWDYCNPAYRVMPEIFRLPADSSNSLFVAARCTALNQGKPIDSEMDTALDLTNLMRETSPSKFNTDIDNAPHGVMHNYIGGFTDDETFFNPIYNVGGIPGLMANIQSAAFDPIFWVHHSNIDYIWQNWLISPNGEKPDLTELQAAPMSYTFFRADKTMVTYTVEEAYKLAFSLPVTYDNMGTESMNPKTTGEGKRFARSAKPNALKGREMTFLHLIVSFPKEPAGTYSVYIRNSAEKKLDSREQSLGVMNFFGAGHHAMHGPDHGDHNKKMTKEFRFDITNKIDVKKFDGNLDFLIKKIGNKKETDDVTIDEIHIESWPVK
jgi:hypothetical protein